MRNTWLVLKHTVRTTLGRRSFWIMTFLMPVFLIAINAYTMFQEVELGSTDTDSTSEEIDADTAKPDDRPTIGLVDEAGLIAEMPADIPADLFVPFPDETAARVALDSEEIEQYVYIPADYVATGEVTVFARNFQILSSGENMGVAFNSTNEWVLRHIIDFNLTGDEKLITVLRNPVPGTFAESHVINPPQKTDANDQALAELVSSLVPYIFYFILLMGSSYLMRSVVAEKENRTVEVLLVSLHPRELMVGKILAMSVVTLVQLAVWFGGGMLILNRGAELMNVSEFTFPPGFIVWTFLFLLLGYLLFATIMAAVGAISPNAREGAQMTWLLILPLMPTLMFGGKFLEEPHGTMALVLSLFPFSAPSAMVTRLAVAEVPLWQVFASLAGLALTTYLFIILAGRFFRADNLLSGASFNWRRLATEWRK